MDQRTIYSRFKAMVEKHPDEVAVVDENGAVSYRLLDAMANAIMARLDAVDASDIVGIVMNHGGWQIAAMLGVVKSGRAYVPAEPSLPEERIDYMMSTAKASTILTDDYCRNLNIDVKPLVDRSRPDGLAYILYTSGTSGRPKGVAVENHSVVNYAEAFEDEFHVGRGDRMLQFSVCSFDIFVEEVFGSLLNGATVCVPPEAIRNGNTGTVERLLDFIEREEVTIIDAFPYLIAEINDLGRLPQSVRLIISGGDVVRASYISGLRGREVMIYNTYGPSETTVCSNYYRIDNAEPLDDGTFPIGHPVKGVDVKILNNDGNEVHRGTTGEICIFGQGVSRGYIGNPPEQRNFVTLPDGTRYYRSGDMGYVLPDGNFAFIHRRDGQVMILGRRVEPDEVENVLNSCPGVDRGIVRSFVDENSLSYLVAYFLPKAGCRLHEIKRWLASKLTDYMIPEFFVKLTSIPLTRRGKVDVQALPVVMKEGDPRFNQFRR